MKIEDLYYNLPTEPADEASFNLEKWRHDNPMDYFKAVHLILNAEKNVSHILNECIKETTFQTIYKITRLHIPEVLYKFGSLTDNEDMNEKKFQTLQKQQIFMSDIKDFNDPFDGKAFYYDPEKLIDIESLAAYHGRLIDDFTAFHKASSLTSNDVNCLPMWAHYSNNHRGFCVAYDMNSPNNRIMSSCTYPVQYTDQRLDITSFMRDAAIQYADEFNRQKALGHKYVPLNSASIIYLMVFLTNVKQLSWEYEKEFRCTMGSTAEGMPYINATPKEIYIGMNCMPAHANRLKQIAQNLGIPAYQMFFDGCAPLFNLSFFKEK